MGVRAKGSCISIALLSLTCQFLPGARISAQTAASQHDTTQRGHLDTLPVAPGARVRLQVGLPPRSYVGVLQGQDSSHVLLSTCLTCGSTAIDARQISGIQVSQGRTSSHIVAGAIIGALLGTAVGLVVVQNHINNTHPCDGCGLAILAVPEFTGGGLFIGTVAGALMRQERWVSLAPSPR